MSSVNKDEVIAEYERGLSLPDLEQKFGVARSTARHWLKKAGKLRGRVEAIKASAHKISAAHKGVPRTMPPGWRENVSKGRQRWAEENAAGVSKKPNGYLEHTNGPNKGRLVHVVIMERRIGRKLLHDECVHHIDGQKTNNHENNLALLTRSGHSRLHRREQRLSKGKSQ